MDLVGLKRAIYPIHKYRNIAPSSYKPLFLLILTFPNSIFRIVSFVSCELYHKTLCRKIRGDMDVQKNPVLLILICNILEALNISISLLAQFIRNLQSDIRYNMLGLHKLYNKEYQLYAFLYS